MSFAAGDGGRAGDGGFVVGDSVVGVENVVGRVGAVCDGAGDVSFD